MNAVTESPKKPLSLDHLDEGTDTFGRAVLLGLARLGKHVREPWAYERTRSYRVGRRQRAAVVRASRRHNRAR